LNAALSEKRIHVMLSRTELSALQAHREYPSVTILLPTHRSAPANRQDRIRARGLVREATDRLHGEFSRREVSAVAANLQSLLKQVDWEHTLDGLALFASRGHASAATLPFRVRARAVVDATFATRDLVFTLNRAPRYRVLVLDEKATRLYDASTAVLDEHTAKPFPLVHTGPGGRGRLPGGRGVDASAVRDKAHAAFFRTVDGAVARLQETERLPIVVAGVERHLASFRAVTRQPEAIAGLLAGSHGGTPPAALGKLAWPVLQAGATLRRTQALVRLDEAVAARRYASGIDQVWRAAFEKRCETLLVEAGFEHPADVSAEGDRLQPYSGRGPAALDDAVDEVIERTLAGGGEVFFYGEGTLGRHQRIAAVLRY
jgi:hypothetical protein